ncbi:PAP2-domain-containing protein [Hesseltinella vesiculosa]|uniref:PAP2-domain-containing protein n=1 Tax=Hesseltinella vesiculosa TaxID=101127 RepID=A0A1X2GNS1_9FUNG|nr:PAP2-domain-containing protein [Hesseltinella vesiculosa]
MNGLLSILASTKVWFASLVFLLCVYYRSIQLIYFTFGACCTAVVGKVLKRLLKQPRPYGQKGYGMPSTHSQVMMFFACYSQYWQPESFEWAVLAMSVFAVLVAWSRVHLRYHTLAQVLVGSVIGGFLGLVWYRLWLWIDPLLHHYLDTLPLASRLFA